MEFDVAENEVVMPFIVCKSHGGPYDDEAFDAGCFFAEWVTKLQVGEPAVAHGWVPAKLAPQLNLLAMHQGYTFQCDEEVDDDGYVFITFILNYEDAEEEVDEE